MSSRLLVWALIFFSGPAMAQTITIGETKYPVCEEFYQLSEEEDVTVRLVKVLEMFTPDENGQTPCETLTEGEITERLGYNPFEPVVAVSRGNSSFE